jgi:tyrosyl-tRNA synthetase
VVTAEKISHALFSGDLRALTADEIAQGFKDVPSVDVPSGQTGIVEFLVDLTHIEPSRRQAREDVQNGAIYVNGERQQSLDFVVDTDAAFGGHYVIIRKGKKKYTLVKVQA